jgi:hypothetical protein
VITKEYVKNGRSWIKLGLTRDTPQTTGILQTTTELIREDLHLGNNDDERHETRETANQSQVRRKQSTDTARTNGENDNNDDEINEGNNHKKNG